MKVDQATLSAEACEQAQPWKHPAAKAYGRAYNSYSRYLNAVRRRSGHLWQNRFYRRYETLARRRVERGWVVNAG